MAKRSRAKKVPFELDINPDDQYSVKLDDTIGPSICWKYFGHLYKNEKIFDDKHYYCRLCFPNKIGSRYELKTSTSNLNKHLSLDHNIETNSTSAAVRRTTGILENRGTSTNKKSRLARQIALWLSRDLKPFSTVSSQAFIDFALSTGIIENIEELPTDRSIAGAALNDVYLMVETGFKKEIKNLSSVYTLMSDLWTDSSGNTPYINISVQFLNSRFELKVIHLVTEKLVRPHTKERIAQCIGEALSKAGIQNSFFYYVTDGGRNMVASSEHLKDCIKHLKCAAHSINLALSTDMENLDIWREMALPVLAQIKRIHGALAYKKNEIKTLFNQQQSKEIFEYLDECESTILEQIAADEEILMDSNQILSDCFNIQMNLMATHNIFQTSTITRWNSNHLMIKTFLKNYSSINACLARLNKQELFLSQEQYSLVIELNSFFESFETPLKVLQSSSEPTSHMLILVINSIKKKLMIHSCNDSLMLRQAFALASSNLDKRIKIEDEWIMAAILDPAQVNSRLIESILEEKDVTKKALINDFVEKFDINSVDSLDSSNQSENSTECETSFAKRLRLDLLHESYDHQMGASSQASNLDLEIDKYFYLAPSFRLNVDVTKFWLNNKNEFPILFRLAQYILGLSPTSAFCEHSFSLSGAVLNKKRSKLNPVLASKQLFINANFKLYEQNRDKI